jgi:hypothetical protein
MTNRWLKILKLIPLAGLVLTQASCATSEEDLGYKPASHQQSTTSGDTSYHGWSAPPDEGSSQ